MVKQKCVKRPYPWSMKLPQDPVPEGFVDVGETWNDEDVFTFLRKTGNHRDWMILLPVNKNGSFTSINPLAVKRGWVVSSSVGMVFGDTIAIRENSELFAQYCELTGRHCTEVIHDF